MKVFGYRDSEISHLYIRSITLCVVASLVLTTAVIEIPFLANAFGFTPIGFAEYATSLALAFSIIPIVEIIKAVQRAAAKRKASR